MNRVSNGSDNGLSPFRRQAIIKNQCWVIVNSTPRNKLQLNFNRNTKLFIHENASANIVCEIAFMLSRVRGVKPCCMSGLTRVTAINIAWASWHSTNVAKTWLTSINRQLCYSSCTAICLIEAATPISLQQNYRAVFVIGKDSHGWVEFLRETAVVVPDGVKRSRASQWRSPASLLHDISIDMIKCDYV